MKITGQAKAGGRYDKELKRRVSWWKHGDEHFPRTSFQAGSKTKKGETIDLHTGEIGEVAESIVTYLLDEAAPERIPAQMYHGTVESRANRIWKYGLEPRGTGQRNYAWAQKGVYLTTNPSVAKHFGAAGNATPEDEQGRGGRSSLFGREDVIVLTISTKGLDPKKFKVDPTSRDSLIYRGTIPPANIVDWEKEGEEGPPPKADLGFTGQGSGYSIGDNTAIGVAGGGG